MRTSVKVKILGETSVKETETQCSLLPAALSFSLIGLSHEPGALGIIIYPLREVYASLNLTYILYHIFFEKSNFLFYGERGGLYPGCPAIRSP